MIRVRSPAESRLEAISQALTKMDWNNDGTYDRLPVTLNFAGTLAIIVKQMPKLEPRSYPIRLFM